MRGAQVLWGRCYEGEGAPAYWPWVQAIRAYAHECEPQQLASEMGPGAADIAEVVSEVRERLPGLPEQARLEPEQARFRLFDSVAGFLKNASSHQPLMLVLDDLHWGDKSSLLLLQFLAREVASSRLLILGTYRDVELSRQHPLSETLAELARNQLSERILLRGLTEPDVARFIEQSASVSPMPGLVAAVYRETEGNPFFIHEIVRLLVKEGRLDQPDSDAEWSLSVPQGVREVVGRRLNTLSTECNAILTVAAVIGREFETDVLGPVAEVDSDGVLQAVDEAIGARVVEEFPGEFGRYRFSHALIQETLYEELTTPRRVRLHRRVGEALEKLRPATSGAHLSELAHHFFQAVQGGDVEKVLAYLTRAAEHAAGLTAYEEAAGHYDRALQVLDFQSIDDPNCRYDVLLSLGDVLHKSGARDRAVVAIEQAAQVARSLRDLQRLARAVCAYADTAWQIFAQNATTLRLLDEALAALPAGDSPERALLLGCFAREQIGTETPERVRAAVEEFKAMAEGIDDDDLQRRILFNSWFIYWQPENTEARLEISRGLERLAKKTADRPLELFAIDLRMQVDIEMGDIAAADLNAEQSHRLALELRQPESLARCQVIRAMRALMRGEFEEGEKLAQEAYATGQRAQLDFAVQAFGIQLSRVRSEQGRLSEIEGLMRSFVEKLPQIAGYRARLGTILAELGKREEAREHYEALAADDFAGVPNDAVSLISFTYLAQLAHYFRDVERARRLYDRLQPAAHLNVMVGFAACNGSVHHWLGLLAWTLSRWEDAGRHFETAVRRHEEMGARPLAARSQLAYAEMLMERSAPGDGEQAIELLNSALDVARELGMKMVLERALSMKLTSQGADTSDTKHSIYAIAASVGNDRPDLGAAAAPDGAVTLMFSDMEGFTCMTEKLGDAEAHRVVQEHHVIVRAQTQAHRGHEVELRGDGFLLAFPRAVDAVNCAIAIQRALAAYNVDHPQQPIRVRIGLHTGEAIRDADKFFGKTVIQASRIADLARAEEILVSSLVRELLEPDGAHHFTPGREVELKGFSGTHGIHPVDWR